jgi:hypothetical protein
VADKVAAVITLDACASYAIYFRSDYPVRNKQIHSHDLHRTAGETTHATVVKTMRNYNHLSSCFIILSSQSANPGVRGGAVGSGTGVTGIFQLFNPSGRNNGLGVDTAS